MKKTNKKYFLAKSVFALILAVVFVFTAGFSAIKAEAANPSEAAETLKYYIVRNGDTSSSGNKYISEYISGLFGTIEYESADEELQFNISAFYTYYGSRYMVYGYFFYDLSTNQVTDNEGVIMFGEDDPEIIANTDFSLNYHDKDPLIARLEYGYADTTTLSSLTTTIFSTGMQMWNDMIEDVTDDQYNIGNLGFVNYITPKETVIPDQSTSDSNPMYRLYNPNSGEHFYTADNSEANHLVSVGWRYEGIGWYAPKSSSTPVYRLYNPNAGDHHYTLDKAEHDNLVRIGWRDEGIGWYSDENQGVPLYRQYNPNARSGSHNYTTSKEENDYLVQLGWRAEGIGWYGIK